MGPWAHGAHGAHWACETHGTRPGNQVVLAHHLDDLEVAPALDLLSLRQYMQNTTGLLLQGSTSDKLYNKTVKADYRVENLTMSVEVVKSHVISKTMRVQDFPSECII